MFDFYGHNKILNHYDKIFGLLRGENITPVTVGFNITNKCNFKCGWCFEEPYRRKNKDAELHLGIILKAIYDMHKCGVRSITFEGGGEPTIHRDFFSLCSSLPSCGINYGLITNGSMLNRMTLEQASKFSYIRVSLDSGDRDTFIAVHGVDNFHGVMEGIKRIRDIGYSGILGVSYIIANTTTNIGIVDITARLKKIGVDYIQFKPVVGVDRDVCYVKCDDLLASAVSMETDKFKVILHRLCNTDSAIKPSGSPVRAICHAHRFIGAITATGSVEVCCSLKHVKDTDEFSFGNLYDDDFRTIWESTRREDILRKVETSAFVQRCPYCRLDGYNTVIHNEKVKHSGLKGESLAMPKLWEFI